MLFLAGIPCCWEAVDSAVSAPALLKSYSFVGASCSHLLWGGGWGVGGGGDLISVKTFLPTKAVFGLRSLITARQLDIECKLYMWYTVVINISV